ncbi:SDR family NAD(P)-dependent oxidoreductase [Sphingobium sp. HWE2-09]|uniref:SDR family NAD(P)-dependent oxidoreductase n=1 Tax=Sphingobium sp. HWE2-09 TaxID=3108390 RepID=UPI002DC87ED2|nr:SDR family oxidoreductase [Sphingobium sp. HWE2-09]
MKLNDKVALVTGGAGGIGSVIARQLCEAGATVVIADIEAGAQAEATVSAIAAAGGKIYMMELDQRSPEAITHCARAIEQNHGRLDILVNNAAWNIRIPFDDLDALTLEIWDRISETNFRGPFLLVRACAALLKAGGGGHVVNISSVGGLHPIGSSIAYSASKAGLNHLTRCLAVAMAPEVSVNCIASGFVMNTGMSNRAVDPATQEAAGKRSLLGHATQPQDIAAQVLTFVTSTSMTGQTVLIDAGLADGHCL